jgi:hypothetical protein
VLVQTLPGQSHHERLQLATRELHAGAKMRARSDKVTLLQTACTQPQAKAIVDEHLHAAGSAVHEQVRMMRASRTEHAYYPSECGIHSGSHVQRLHSKPRGIDADHFMSSRSSSAHSPAAEAGHSILTVLEPRRTSMRIAASVALEEILTGTKPPAFSAATLGAEDPLGTSNVPLSARSTQRRSRFAFSPRARAIAATETPGCWQALTASALNSALWRRRRRRPVLTACSEVSTCPPTQVDTYAPILGSGREGEFASPLQICYLRFKNYLGNSSRNTSRVVCLVFSARASGAYSVRSIAATLLRICSA